MLAWRKAALFVSCKMLVSADVAELVEAAEAASALSEYNNDFYCLRRINDTFRCAFSNTS